MTLTATPASGGSFTEWGGACSGRNACTITIAGDASVTATFSGSGTAGATFPLTVSVSGEGTVTGGGLNCGTAGSVCSQNETAGSAVTLTATPASGAAFTRWGGACSGTTRTCSVTMSGAKSVTAAFAGGSSAEVALSVTVAGSGTVTGGGIRCGNGAKTCSVDQRQGSAVALTATPAPGAGFAGWGGACSGATPTCTVEMNAAKSVSARFASAPGATGTGAAVLRSRGRPVVTRTATGFSVTLRFRTNRPGTVRVRAFRAGRLEAALSFAAPSGSAAVGPFPLGRAGFYALDLTQAGRALHWGACLGRCGEAAGRAAGAFVLGRKAANVVDAGALWSVTLNFRSSQPAGVDLRVYRGGQLARRVRFPARPGPGCRRPAPALAGELPASADRHGWVRTPPLADLVRTAAVRRSEWWS